MSTPAIKKPKKAPPRSNRKKNLTKELSREASRMGAPSQMGAPSAVTPIPVPVSDPTKKGTTMSTMSQVKSTKSKNHKKEEKKKGSKNDEADSKKPDSASKDDESSTKKEKEPKKFLKIVGGREIKLQEHLRNPVHLGEFNAVNEKNEKFIVRLEPSNRGKLKFGSDVVAEVEKLFAGQEKVPVLRNIEFCQTQHLNYWIISPFSLQILEILRIVKALTVPCAFNVALQTLDAIQYLHQAGFLNRNIKPASFSVGLNEEETKIYMTDYRLVRTHIDPSTKKVRPARTGLKYGGTARYASIAGLKKKDQGRKDDVEAWIYMIYDLIDPENGLSWRKSPRCNMMIKEKENFKYHVLPHTYDKVPEEFKKLVDLVHGYSYDSLPDYAAFKEIVQNVGKSKGHDMTTCDWVGKITPVNQEIAIKTAAEKSTGNKCSGDDDFEFKTARPVRKIMNPDDVITNGQYAWKVVRLLGSGGFGDVYKVFDDKAKGPKKTHYALKTESEGGKKAMLRLKVEMQVMITISDARKKSKGDVNRHFVDFIDRGKSEELKCKYIVMSLVGPSLDDCRRKFGVNLSNTSTPYIIAIQTLESIRDLHNLGYLHRDIKPANFAVGVGAKESTVFMLDFGIGRSYLDPKTKQHRAPRKKVKFLGTLRYASRACMLEVDQGRKDDLECWIYMVFDIFDPKNGVSWKSREIESKFERLSNYFSMVKFETNYHYINSLQFQTTPEYANLVKTLYTSSSASGYPIHSLDDGGWVGKLKKEAKSKMEKKTARFGDSSSESGKQSGTDED